LRQISQSHLEIWSEKSLENTRTQEEPLECQIKRPKRHSIHLNPRFIYLSCPETEFLAGKRNWKFSVAIENWNHQKLRKDKLYSNQILQNSRSEKSAGNIQIYLKKNALDKGR
jgi:hypothetical protein